VNKQSTTDSFYDAIRNLGSQNGGTGADSSKNPKKSPNSGGMGGMGGVGGKTQGMGKKKIITPNDINGLFVAPPTAEERAEMERMDGYEDEDDDDEVHMALTPITPTYHTNSMTVYCLYYPYLSPTHTYTHTQTTLYSDTYNVYFILILIHQ
jgi:hypothetical protein